MTSEEIKAAIDSMSSDELEAYGLVRGPVDSEGVMWHLGDMSDTSWGVIGDIAYIRGKWLVCGHDITAPWTVADGVRHYHKPTVEDVLREFGDEVRMCCDTEDTITEYAEKLREVIDND